MRVLLLAMQRARLSLERSASHFEHQLPADLKPGFSEYSQELKDYHEKVEAVLDELWRHVQRLEGR
jgi:hypothetical protein